MTNQQMPDEESMPIVEEHNDKYYVVTFKELKRLLRIKEEIDFVSTKCSFNDASRDDAIRISVK